MISSSPNDTDNDYAVDSKRNTARNMINTIGENIFSITNLTFEFTSGIFRFVHELISFLKNSSSSTN